MDLANLKLSADDERKLYAQLAHRYGRVDSKYGSLTEDEQLVWDAINEAMGIARPLAHVMKSARKQDQITRDELAESVRYVMSWLDHGCRRRPISRTQRMAILSTAMECLARFVSRGGAPQSHAAMLRHLDQLPIAVDRGFPGYAEAGILDAMARVAVAA